jgi:hypothetical protein
VAVVVGRADAAVDLRGGEDEAAPLAQRDDLVHRHSGDSASGGADSKPAADKPAADKPKTEKAASKST